MAPTAKSHAPGDIIHTPGGDFLVDANGNLVPIPDTPSPPDTDKEPSAGTAFTFTFAVTLEKDYDGSAGQIFLELSNQKDDFSLPLQTCNLFKYAEKDINGSTTPLITDGWTVHLYAEDTSANERGGVTLGWRSVVENDRESVGKVQDAINSSMTFIKEGALIQLVFTPVGGGGASQDDVDRILDALNVCYNKTYTIEKSTGNYPSMPSSDTCLAINTDDCPGAPRIIIAENTWNGGDFKEGRYTLGDAVIDLTQDGSHSQDHDDYDFSSYHYDLIEGTMPAVGETATLAAYQCDELLDASDLLEDQQRQDDELERIEKESKKRDLFAELQLLYLAKQNQICSFHRSCEKNKEGPPFSSGHMFNVSGNVISIASEIYNDMRPEVGNILRITSNYLLEDWESVITRVGDKQRPPTGWHLYEITVSDVFSDAIANAPNGTQFSIGACEDSDFVTSTKFAEDQKRQDDAIGAERQTRALEQARLDQHLKAEAEQRKREESELYARIDELAAKPDYDDFKLREDLEKEKAFRVEGDNFLGDQLQQEQYARMDADQKLLARINGLEIPEMPEDYDDSNLRELIENEGALRATGDAALNKKIDLTEDKVVSVNEKLEEEKKFRTEGDEANALAIQNLQRQADNLRQSEESEKAARLEADATLDQQLKSEAEQRKREESEIYARIDEIHEGRDLSSITVTPGERAVWVEGDQPLADPKGRAGWFFETRNDPKSQAYYTIWSQDSKAPTQLTLADIEAVGIVLRNQGTVNPFIQVQTRRKSDGNNATSTYRSRVSYVCGDDLRRIPAITVLTTNIETPLYGNVSRHLLVQDPSSVKGPLEGDEVISKIIIGTSSGQNAGATSMLIEQFFLQSKDAVDVVTLSSQTLDEPYDDSDIREKLEEERALRATGDKALDTKIELTEDKIVSVNEKLEEEKQFRVEGDEKLAKGLIQLEAEDQRIKAELEREKGFRVTDDAKIASSLVEEARIRADEDYKLLARINGLDIPEMPQDYDDSNLRELIENESALRATGDMGLNELINVNRESITQTKEDLLVEGQNRIEADLKIQADVRTETSAREAGDRELHERIDDLEQAPAGVDPETFAADQLRQDNALAAAQEVSIKADLKLVEDQKRQDQEFEDYKTEIADEQAAQDAIAADNTSRIEALEAVPPGSGADYLNDLKDVDLSPTRSLVSVRANDYATTWQKYVRTDYPQSGNFARTPTNTSDRTLVVNNEAKGGVDASPLFNQIRGGVRLRLETKIRNQQWDEVCEADGIIQYSDYQYIKFRTQPKWLAELANEPAIDGAATCTVRLADVTPDPTPTPEPTPDPITPDPTPTPDPIDPNLPNVDQGTFLGFDKARALWVPMKIAGGTSDLSGYYTKAEVDDLIDGIDVSVDLDKYYTKDEIDAIENDQDARLDALELNSGSGSGGSVELSGYYKKSETYNKTEVDDLIAGVDTSVNLDDYYTKPEIDQQYRTESSARVTGDLDLQAQIDDLKRQSPDAGLADLEVKVTTNTAGILKNKQEIAQINEDQKEQNKNISSLEKTTLAGLDNRYTKEEVDNKFDAIEDIDVDNLLAKDEDNKVTSDFRIASSVNTDTFISFADNKLGLYNLRPPEHAHHAISKGYSDEGDRTTLQKSKDYADSKLDNYYSKTEIDDSQEEQDNKIEELETSTNILQSQVEKNATDITILEALNVRTLNDLEDVELSTFRNIRNQLRKPLTRDGDTERPQTTDTDTATEELLHTNTWTKFRIPGNTVQTNEWALTNWKINLCKNLDQKNEWQEFLDKLEPGNKIHVVGDTNTGRECTQRYTIQFVEIKGNEIIITTAEDLTTLLTFVNGFNDYKFVDLSVSFTEISLSPIPPVPPIEPDEPQKRSDVVLGYDRSTKIWTPHKADYLPLEGGRLTGGLKFRRGNKDWDQFSINPNSSDSATSVYQRNGGQFRIRTTPDKDGTDNYKTHFIAAQPTQGNPETRISWLVKPTSSHHAVNKEYCDRQVFTPPGLEFWYQTDTGSTNDMPEGKFAIASAKNRMRISTISRYVDLTSSIPTGDFNYDGCVWPFTIWYRRPSDEVPDGSEHAWRMKVTGFLTRIDFHAKDLYCYIGRSQWSASAFSVDVNYMIHIGGLF